jgi:hypothetical protein
MACLMGKIMINHEIFGHDQRQSQVDGAVLVAFLPLSLE